MPWLPPKEAAPELKIASRTLRDRAALPPSHPLHVKRNADGLYWVDDDEKWVDVDMSEEARAIGETLVSDARRLATTLDDVKHDEGANAAYYYDEARDKYLFSLRSKAQAGKPFVLAGDTVRALLLAYSKDGSDATLNEICRTFGLNRTTLREILRGLGKTHDSAPFTDEEIAERGEEELAEDLVRLKEERVIRRAEKASWEQTKKLADEARHFDRFIARRLTEIISAGAWAPPASAPAIHLPKRGMAKVSAVFGLTDAHVGAKAWAAETGTENNIDIVRERTLNTTRRLIERVLRYTQPVVWLLPSGSDNIHADTDLGTTTKGTPLDTDGSLARMYLAACSLYEEIIAMLRAVAPVEIFAMPGNHDRVMSLMLTHWLAARFHGDEAVTVGSCVKNRTYHLHGKSLIGFTHGDTMKDEKLPQVMAAEAPREWGASEHRMIFTGHLHTDKSNEYAGCRVIRMPTLARVDRWHDRSGYVGNTKAIAAYLVDHDEGLVASLPVQAGAE